MSPRAAWWLEDLGFKNVYDYVPGKADWLANGWREEAKQNMYARVTNIRFSPELRAEVVRAAQALARVLREQRGFNGLQVLIDQDVGKGIIVSFWETEADAEASEASSSYIGQMSMMSSFLSERLAPETYQVDVRA